MGACKVKNMSKVVIVKNAFSITEEMCGTGKAVSFSNSFWMWTEQLGKGIIFLAFDNCNVTVDRNLYIN